MARQRKGVAPFGPNVMPLLPKILEGFQPSPTPFDPGGTWEQGYRVLIIGRVSPPYQEWQSISAGALSCKREPAQEGSFRLRVRFVANQSISGKSMDYVEAELLCASDRFASLRRWRRHFLSLSPDGAPVPGSMVSETGEVAKGYLIFRSTVERKVPLDGPLTANWAVFELLQRLPREGVEEMRFAMLEELEFLRWNQRLVPGKPFEFELGGQRLRWDCFHQFGDGVLPWTYCLDEQRRLVLAASAMRAYVFDPTVVVQEVGQ